MKKYSGFRAAVDAKCKDCIYDDKAPGTWRQQTEDCPRPKSRGQRLRKEGK